MRQNILEQVMKKTGQVRQNKDDGMYEDPRDIIVTEKPVKPPRKRTAHTVTTTSTCQSKDKSLAKEQKRKLTKKYEILVTSLMEKCEENIAVISEKDNQIAKLKDKLKTVLEYNKLFAEENDQLRKQYEVALKYVEDCKTGIREERSRNRDLEEKNKELDERVKKFEMPDRDNCGSTAIPLVEVCMSCSSRQIILNQAREQNSRLQKDMQALKDVLYRLNVQLANYQERLRSSRTDSKTECAYKPSEKYNAFDSLITTSLVYKGTGAANDDGHSQKTVFEEQHSAGRVTDLSGLLSAQALAPLFDAYQDNLQEKDNLIVDYEKQFENMNKKSKLIVDEKKGLSERVKALEMELAETRQKYKKVHVEKETADIEKATLLERAERAETKLKEVFELYENKITAMMRDYETVHREYFAVKNALEASEGKMAQLDALRARTVPADLHERRLEHCKRLLEELKHQYNMETERKNDQLAKMQERVAAVDDKFNKLNEQYQRTKQELEVALKNVRLYRKAAVIFRQRLKATTARFSKARNSARRSRTNNEPLKRALMALDKIKQEIKLVKARAYSSLDELERRLLSQERRAAHAHAEHRRELERASLALEHKENIIRNLIDKVADVEEVRLSQTNTQRLQGVVSDSSDDESPLEG
nr:protein Cep89 homolog isoform X2 [Bombyx mori]